MIDEPQVEVTCDKCSHNERFSMTQLVQRGWDNRNLEAKLKKAGWELSNGLDGETICSNCVEDAEEG